MSFILTPQNSVPGIPGKAIIYIGEDGFVRTRLGDDEPTNYDPALAGGGQTVYDVLVGPEEEYTTVQAGIDALGGGGGTVAIKPGVYDAPASIPSNTRLVGLAPGVSNLAKVIQFLQGIPTGLPVLEISGSPIEIGSGAVTLVNLVIASDKGGVYRALETTGDCALFCHNCLIQTGAAASSSDSGPVIQSSGTNNTLVFENTAICLNGPDTFNWEVFGCANPESDTVDFYFKSSHIHAPGSVIVPASDISSYRIYSFRQSVAIGSGLSADFITDTDGSEFSTPITIAGLGGQTVLSNCSTGNITLLEGNSELVTLSSMTGFTFTANRPADLRIENSRLQVYQSLNFAYAGDENTGTTVVTGSTLGAAFWYYPPETLLVSNSSIGPCEYAVDSGSSHAANLNRSALFQGCGFFEFSGGTQPPIPVPITFNSCTFSNGVSTLSSTVLGLHSCVAPGAYLTGTNVIPITITHSTFTGLVDVLTAGAPGSKTELLFDTCSVTDISLDGRVDLTLRNTNVSGDITVDVAESQKIVAHASYINKIEAGPGNEFDIFEVEADACTIGEIEVVGFDFAIQPSLTLTRCTVGNITSSVAAGGDLLALVVRDCTVSSVTLSGYDENTLVIDWYPSIASAYQQGTVFNGLPVFNYDYFNVYPITGEPTFSVDIAPSKHTVFDVTEVPVGGTVVTLPDSIEAGGVPGRFLTFTNTDESATTGSEITFTGAITPTGGGSIESGGRSSTFLCVLPGSWTVTSQSP